MRVIGGAEPPSDPSTGPDTRVVSVFPRDSVFGFVIRMRLPCVERERLFVPSAIEGGAAIARSASPRVIPPLMVPRALPLSVAA